MGIAERDAVFVRKMRRGMGLTRSQFARLIGASVGQVKSMESGLREISFAETFILFLALYIVKEKKLDLPNLNDEQFSSLVKLVRGQDWTLPERRQAECRQMVEELLEGEFKARVKQKIITFLVDTEKEPFLACVMEPFLLKNFAAIFVMASNWKTYPDFNSDDLRQILRHELLHVELNAKDGDPRFIAEAKRRSIPLEYSSRRKR